jgi:hypothetical protein
MMNIKESERQEQKAAGRKAAGRERAQSTNQREFDIRGRYVFSPGRGGIIVAHDASRG